MFDSRAATSVLLVEDNEVDVEITRRTLTKSGANVRLRVARDGQEALEALDRFGRPDAPPEDRILPRLVLLDIQLPAIDGREILRRIKDDPRLSAIPVAVLTGMTGEKLMLECMALGGNMHFTKPITAQDITNLVGAVERYWELIEQIKMRNREQPAFTDRDREQPH